MTLKLNSRTMWGFVKSGAVMCWVTAGCCLLLDWPVANLGFEPLNNFGWRRFNRLDHRGANLSVPILGSRVGCGRDAEIFSLSDSHSHHLIMLNLSYSFELYTQLAPISIPLKYDVPSHVQQDYQLLLLLLHTEVRHKSAGINLACISN